jgi:hypothetical protein
VPRLSTPLLREIASVAAKAIAPFFDDGTLK